jgi:hypothetical protein
MELVKLDGWIGEMSAWQVSVMDVWFWESRQAHEYWELRMTTKAGIYLEKSTFLCVHVLRPMLMVSFNMNIDCTQKW